MATQLWTRSLATAVFAFGLTFAAGGITLAATTAEEPTGVADETSEPTLDPELLKQIQEAQQFERDALAKEAAAAEAVRAARAEELRLEQEAAAEEARLRAEEAAKIQREISKEMGVQSGLMKRSRNDSEDTPADPALNAQAFLDSSYLGQTDPRTAEPAPLLRDLPPEIFDEEEVRIEAGTWGDHRKLRLVLQVLDADGDGAPELRRYREPDTSELVRQEDDSDYDGQIDSWSDYEDAELVQRALDTTKDGRPDTWERFHAGWLSARDIDRDSDDVRDVFLVYENGELTRETHDSNNDGRIDLVILYRDRLRSQSEEDQDHDGRMDFWTFFRSDGGEEQVHRVERDTAGRGFADVFDIFESDQGELFLSQRNSDVNGDGKIDVMRFYHRGKLVRMEVADADVM